MPSDVPKVYDKPDGTSDGKQHMGADHDSRPPRSIKQRVYPECDQHEKHGHEWDGHYRNPASSPGFEGVFHVFDGSVAETC